MVDLFQFAQKAGEFLDLSGVFIILTGVAFSTAVAIVNFFEKKKGLYTLYRQNLGRSILLGLEFLVAGDIIRSITGNPSFTAVAVLAIIVLIRTFLSITFDMEIEGHWPWKKRS